jgi:hypothetical protein
MPPLYDHPLPTDPAFVIPKQEAEEILERPLTDLPSGWCWLLCDGVVLERDFRGNVWDANGSRALWAEQRSVVGLQ